MASSVGSQAPRIAHEPDLRLSDGDDAIFLGSSYGLTPDEWQARVIRSWLATDRSGGLRVGRAGLAVPRQNGKNGILEIVELFKMVAQGRKILHTAHEVKTARKAFLRLASFFENERKFPEMAELVSEIRRTNGQEAIVLVNGGSCEFVARSRGSGRGFTVDDLVCDEAQELTDEQLEALLPTISSAPSGDPQQIYTGTPPGPGVPGVVFTRVREHGVLGNDKRLSWHEWSIPDDVLPAVAVRSWRELAFETNPALGVRLNIQTVKDELGAMSMEGFCRERLGKWDTMKTGDALIAGDQWLKLYEADKEIVPVRRVVGVKFSVDGSLVGLALGLDQGEGPVHVSGIRLASAAEGIGWIVKWCVERRDVLDQIVIDGRGSDAVLSSALIEAGFPSGAKAKKATARFLRVPSALDYAEAHAAFLEAVQGENLTHGDSPLLDEQVGGSMRRDIGKSGGWGWQPIRDTDNTTLLDAATLAWWGAKTCTRKANSKGVRVG